MSTASWRPRVGDRVRVRDGVGETHNCDELPHHPEEQGHTGHVVSARALPGAPSHAYLVVFDQPYPRVVFGMTDVPLAVRHYAADEVELIPESD